MLNNLKCYRWAIIATCCTFIAAVFAEPIGAILGIWLVCSLFHEVKLKALLKEAQDLNNELLKSARTGLQMRRKIFDARATKPTPKQ